MDYITSDLHLDHDNVIRHYKRPYVGSADMRESFIEDINKIPSTSTLYIVGDFVISSKKAPLRAILNRIKPKPVFILGNHDVRLEAVFKEYGETHRLLEIKYREEKVVMCHFPMYEWNRGQYGSIHLHGHTHGGFEGQGKMLDVSWDKHKRILTLDEAYDMADAKPIYQPCHNKNNGLHRHEVANKGIML